MTKHDQLFHEMWEKHKEIFAKFKRVHDQYMNDPITWENQFNIEGKDIVEIIRMWERRLCSHSERGQYGKYSARLAEKFWERVRREFPKIDFVGVKIQVTPPNRIP